MDELLLRNLRLSIFCADCFPGTGKRGGAVEFLGAGSCAPGVLGFGLGTLGAGALLPGPAGCCGFGTIGFGTAGNG